MGLYGKINRIPSSSQNPIGCDPLWVTVDRFGKTIMEMISHYGKKESYEKGISHGH